MMNADAQVFLSPNFLPIFIDAYRNRHCLWRVKCKEYSNKKLKQKAYSDLVELCKTVIPDCNSEFVKKKIDLIRGNFRREHRKVIDSKRSGAGTDLSVLHVPKLWYYKLLLFLSDQEEAPRRQSITSVHPAENSQLIASNTNHADGDELNEHQEEEEDPKPEVEEPPQLELNMPSTSPFGRKNRARSNTYSVCSTQCLQRAVEISQREDEYDKFGGNVAAKLRKMDERQNIFAENLINQVLFQGALGKLQEDSTIHTAHSFSATPSSSTQQRGK